MFALSNSDPPRGGTWLRVGAGRGLRLGRGADLVVNYELVVAKPSGEPDSQTIRFTIRQLW